MLEQEGEPMLDGGKLIRGCMSLSIHGVPAITERRRTRPRGYDGVRPRGRRRGAGSTSSPSGGELVRGGGAPSSGRGDVVDGESREDDTA